MYSQRTRAAPNAQLSIRRYSRNESGHILRISRSFSISSTLQSVRTSPPPSRYRKAPAAVYLEQPGQVFSLLSREGACSADSALLRRREKVAPRVSWILQRWSTWIFGISDQDLSGRRGNFYTVTGVHTALSLPPNKLTKLQLHQRHNRAP
jgi:hypothetical protein